MATMSRRDYAAAYGPTTGYPGLVAAVSFGPPAPAGVCGNLTTLTESGWLATHPAAAFAAAWAEISGHTWRFDRGREEAAALRAELEAASAALEARVGALAHGCCCSQSLGLAPDPQLSCEVTRVPPRLLQAGVRQWMLRRFLRPGPGDLVVDLGCGSGRPARR